MEDEAEKKTDGEIDLGVEQAQPPSHHHTPIDLSVYPICFIMPRSRSSSPSSSPGDLMPNTDATSEFNPVMQCQCNSSKLHAVHVRVWQHRMYASGPLQFITHDAVLITWHCRACNGRFLSDV
ncbi:hypothetical protein niasHT_029027 [Heterodera trifolii]|uniref:Uncharacterized protein n=1 Tax=Heterodera trifolii TaxID=157864 RepID=A0ABD2K943_9BILA